MASSSVREVGRKDVQMHTNRVPLSLRERLGDEGTAGLVELFEEHGSKWTADVISVVSDRFERRLVEEASKLRVEMAHGFAALRQEMAQHRVELLKWAFLFWVGQLFAVASLTALLIRVLRAGV